MTENEDGKEVHPSSYWMSKIGYHYLERKKILSEHLIFQETQLINEYIKETEYINCRLKLLTYMPPHLWRMSHVPKI